jgi:TonB family protein
MPPASTTTPDARHWFADFFDPSLMALPNQQGFSSRLWHGGPVAELPSGDWNIRPAYLPPPPPDTPMVLLKQPTVAQLAETLAEKLPATESTDSSPTPLLPVPATHSALSIVTGTLGRRELLSHTTLPVVTNEIAVRSTRVRVAVRPDGAVQFANLERSCGNEPLDTRAVEHARQLQFTPLTGANGAGFSDLAWGVVRYAWVTAPPPSTNHPAKPAGDISAP